jgi:hypothetical protein
MSAITLTFPTLRAARRYANGLCPDRVAVRHGRVWQLVTYATAKRRGVRPYGLAYSHWRRADFRGC